MDKEIPEKIHILHKLQYPLLLQRRQH